jgi:3-phenylpropionate/cinnamic acid dioxygenase small subunit
MIRLLWLPKSPTSRTAGLIAGVSIKRVENEILVSRVMFVIERNDVRVTLPCS